MTCDHIYLDAYSGVRMKLKLGAQFFVTPLHFFGSTCRISRFGERFRNGQYTVSICATVPPLPSIL